MVLVIPPATSKRRQESVKPGTRTFRPLSAWTDEELEALIAAEAGEWLSCLERLERAECWFIANDQTHPRWEEAKGCSTRLNVAMGRACLSATHAVATLAGRHGQDRRELWVAMMPDPVRTARVAEGLSPWMWWPTWAGPLPDGRTDRPARREDWER